MTSSAQNHFLHRCVLVLFVLIGSGEFAFAQTYLFDNIQLYDPSTNTVMAVAKPTAISSSQELTMPTTVGIRGQLLSIISTTGSAATLGWVTTAVGSVPPSNRLTAQQNAAAPTGLAVSVAASKTYQYRGLILIRRVNAGGGSSDNFALTLTAPSNNVDVHISHRCYNCPANTVNANGVVSANGTTVTSATIDPAGTGTADFTTVCAISIEGDITVGTSGGEIVFTATNAGAGSNNVIIDTQSHLFLREIK